MTREEWLLAYARDVVEACAKAGNSTMNDPTVPWVEPFKCVDVACTAQILSGEYDNSKIAEKSFIDAVLLEAKKYPVLTNRRW